MTTFSADLTPAQLDLVTANDRFAHRMVRACTWLRRDSDPDYDDALQHARIGLVRAARRHDPARGFAFLTLAGYCCRSELARWVRSGRARGYRSTSGPGPRIVSLDATDRDAGGLAEILEGRAEGRPGDQVDVAGLLAVLPAADRAILELRFLDGRTLAEVGAALGVSRQRVYQRQQAALRELRTRLAG